MGACNIFFKNQLFWEQFCQNQQGVLLWVVTQITPGLNFR